MAARIRTWLWWPASRSHALAAAVVVLAVSFLGLAGVPKFPEFKSFQDIRASTGAYVVWSLAIVAANAGIFFINARGDYLQLRAGLRPMAMSFILLTALFPLAVGASRLVVGETRLAAPADADWNYTAKIVLVGEGGLSLVLAIGALWKPSAPEAQDVVALIEQVRPDLRRTFRGERPLLDADEAKRLRARLDLLADKAAKLVARDLLPREMEYADRIAGSAAYVRTSLESPERDLGPIEALDKRLKTSVDALLAESGA